MGPSWIRIAALAVVSTVGISTLAAHADAAAAWLKDRQARFAAYHAAHLHPAAEIARIKAATAALVAAAPPLDVRALDGGPVIWRVSPRPVDLWDGADLPQMIVVPAGEYTMGSPDAEAKRDANESPRHRVRIAYSFAVSKYPITVGEYAQFVDRTGYDAGHSCYNYEGGKYDQREGRSWRAPGFEQAAVNPAVCLSYADAQAYIAWLSKTTGHAYRLLSEAEYEYLNRAGTTGAYWWGEDIGRDQADCDGCGSAWDKQRTAPVDAFSPNGFGLYATTGNNWTWLADCWNDSYVGAPTDGSANLSGDCRPHALRGGSWVSHAWILRSAQRHKDLTDARHVGIGLRVARTL
jgi:formylglycine-generating enzyme required for sulfatase activity